MSVVVVEDRVDDAPALPAAERHLVGPRAVAKRRAEVRAGRWVARRALGALTGAPPEAIVIDRSVDEDAGRPVPRVPGAPEARVSISHAGGFAVAAAARSPIGIDLVIVEPRARSFLDEVFAPGELQGWRAYWRDLEDEVLAAVAFAAKETALKLLGTGMRAPLHAVRLRPAPATTGFVEGLRGLLAPRALDLLPGGALGERLPRLSAALCCVDDRVIVVAAPAAS